MDHSIYGNSQFQLCHHSIDAIGSSYPSHRHKTTDNGDTIGVMGNMQLLQSVTFSSQPISSLDWNNDKEGLFACTSFDQTLRICITTRLNII
jgi:hypothetical protein